MRAVSRSALLPVRETASTPSDAAAEGTSASRKARAATSAYRRDGRTRLVLAPMAGPRPALRRAGSRQTAGRAPALDDTQSSARAPNSAPALRDERACQPRTSGFPGREDFFDSRPFATQPDRDSDFSGDSWRPRAQDLACLGQSRPQARSTEPKVRGSNPLGRATYSADRAPLRGLVLGARGSGYVAQKLVSDSVAFLASFCKFEEARPASPARSGHARCRRVATLALQR